MNLPEIYNWVEIFLWCVIGIVFTARSFKSKFRSQALTAGITFIIFGITDIIEIQTGAWWDPWWLFAIKAICVISLFITFMVYRKIKSNLNTDNFS